MNMKEIRKLYNFLMGSTMTTLKKPDLDSLRENKREMFDGMRAYHQSEISHANHAITMLLAIAGATGAAILAMLFPEKLPEHLTEIAWGLFFVVLLLSVAVAWTSQCKITSDHSTYEAYGKEYVITSKLLGFYDEIRVNGETKKIKNEEDIGKGKGYQNTQRIIRAFAGLLIILTLLFAILLSFHSAPKIQQNTLADPPASAPVQQECG